MVNGRRKGNCLCEHGESATSQKNTGTSLFTTDGMMGGLPVLQQQELRQARRDDWSENLKAFVDMTG